MELAIQNVSLSPNLPNEKSISNWVAVVLNKTNADQAELSIRIVDEDEILALNMQYREKNCPTNVLSFRYEMQPSVETLLLGDIIICAPIVEKEAREQNKTAEAHWAHMVVHGVLHLQGLDHKTDEDAKVMEAIEAQILSKLGFKDPYL